MKILVFLGNPGRKFKKNRHNAGFIIGEIFADEFSIKAKKNNFHAICGTGIVNNTECLLLFPQTYMNNSGLAVNDALNYYNETPGRVIVIHDEIELPFGEVRHKLAGGHKGHNGIRSIIQATGSSDFHRIRIGVGRPDGQVPVADYLLSDFSKEELVLLREKYPEIRKEITSTIH